MEHTIFVENNNERESLKRFIRDNFTMYGIDIADEDSASLRCLFPTVNAVYALALYHGKIKALA